MNTNDRKNTLETSSAEKKDWEYYDLSLVQVRKGKPGVVLARLHILGESVSHAVSRCKAHVLDPTVLVLQTAVVSKPKGAATE